LGIPNIRDRVVQTAAKLVLEPIFEADFGPDSYGFRPKRDAHQALAAIKDALDQGMYWVIDADLASYFDTIPHDRLMKAVAERVVDGSMLALVKMFLETPIVDERDAGRPRRNSLGTPQGGVISPLLANIYLNLLDRNFRRREALGEVQGRLVRYADDLVVLSPKPPDATLQWMRSLLQRMGLSLNPEKTKVKRMVENERFDFLSYQHRRWRGRLFLDIADKAFRRTKEELRRITRCTWLSLDELVEELNAYIRGARDYVRRVRRRTLRKLDIFVEVRVARWWSRKHSRPQPAWWLVQKGALWRQHGLERWDLPRHLRPDDSRGAT